MPCPSQSPLRHFHTQKAPPNRQEASDSAGQSMILWDYRWLERIAVRCLVMCGDAVPFQLCQNALHLMLPLCIAGVSGLRIRFPVCRRQRIGVLDKILNLLDGQRCSCRNLCENLFDVLCLYHQKNFLSLRGGPLGLRDGYLQSMPSLS